MKTLKKLLSLFLCTALVLSFFPAAYAEGEEPAAEQQEESREITGTIAPVTAEEEQTGSIAPARDGDESDEDPSGSGIERISYTVADPQENLTWTFELDDDGGAILTGFEGDLPAALAIPASVEGNTVVGLDWGLFEDCSELTSVSLPSGLKTIRGRAFAGTGLRSLALPSGLLELGEGILFGNEGVKSITIPATLQEAGNGGTYIRPDPYEDEIWMGCGPLGGSAVETLTLADGADEVVHHLAAGAVHLRTVNLPESLTKIGYNAFESCLKLNSIPLPASLREIGTEAFLNCGVLTQLQLPNTVKKIEYRAFAFTGLISLTLPSGLLELGEGILYCNEGVKEITIPATLQEAGNGGAYIRPDPYEDEIWMACGPLGGSAIETLTLADGADEVVHHLAAGAVHLRTVNLPESLTKIGYNAFESCLKLNSIPLPASLREIGTEAFINCGVLTQLQLPNTLKKIEYRAFAFTGLTSLTLPSGLLELGEGILYCNEGVKEITIPATLQEAGNGGAYIRPDPYEDEIWMACGPLGGSAIETLTLADGADEVVHHLAAGAVHLKTVNLPDSVKYIDYNAFKSCIRLTSIQLPSGLLEIRESAFEECSALTSLEIPGTVKKILDGAFAYTGLSALTLQESVKELGCGILFGNTEVKSITIPSSLQETHDSATYISPGENEDDIYTGYGPLGGSAVETLTIAAGAAKVCHHLAAGALHLKTVNLPDSVEQIEYCAFQNCVKLTKIWFTGDAPTMDDNIFEGVKATAYYPGENSSWTSDVMKDYGGTITWVATYDVRFDPNGGTGAPEKQTKLETEDLILSEVTPTRANESAGSYTVTLNANGGSVSPSSLTAARTTSYTFKNWNTAANGSGASYAPGGTYTSNASATLYAQWNSKTTTAAVTLPTPTRTGYSFKGWGTSASSTGGRTGSYTPGANVTFYAVWEPNRYTVSYDANGGVGEPANQEKIHDVTLTLSTVKPTRESEAAGSYTVTLNANGGSVSPASLKSALTTSFTFKNWNTAANGSGTTYASGGSYTANAALTLYAQWNSDTTAATVTLPTPTREGYSFKGWAASATATGGTVGSYTPTGNVTLYAIWSASQYVVTYDANGGTGAPEPQDKTHDVTLKLSTVKPTRESEAAGSYTVTLNANGGIVSPASLNAARTTSYTFKNWNTAANGSGTSYASGGSYTANASATLYAQWNSSTATASVTLPTPEREGYSFLGWATSATAAEGVTGSYTPDGNVTLYAIWEKLPDGTIQIGDVTGKPGSEILVPVSVVGELDVYAFSFHVSYDNTFLVLLGVEDGSLSGWGCNQDAGYVHWLTSADADQHASGVIVNLRFQILETAPDGTTAVTADDFDVVNRAEVEFSLAAIPGSVKVSSRIAGDANDDGLVDIRDLVRLRKYLMHEQVNINLENADVTGDGKATNTDLVRLRKFLVGDPDTVLD